VYVRSKSYSQLEPSLEVSQRPSMVLPSVLNVPVKRCEKFSGEKSAEFLQSFQIPLSKEHGASACVGRWS
jgi:hypothetical protein